MKPLPKKYNHKETEKRWQKAWEESEVYAWDESESRENTYVIDTPPPTVSGLLHMGHVFSYTQADFVARYQRMAGKTVFYPMGFDDNGLPTERLVEKVKKVRATDMSREDFIQLCEGVAEEARAEFRALFEEIALSVDWKQEYHTISEDSRKIAQLSFLDLYNKDRAYRKLQPMLWDPVDQTAIAQAEIEDKEMPSQKNYLHFGLDGDGSRKLEIMTTRPELVGACVAVIYNPDDERYQDLKGKKAITPVFGVKVDIIADDKVDMEKGTGLVMCCTFGDETDITWWREHGLNTRLILNKYGKIDVTVGDGHVSFIGDEGKLDSLNTVDIAKTIDAFEQILNMKCRSNARAKMLELLDQEGAVFKDPENHIHAEPCAERSGSPLEILPTNQWFIKILDQKSELKAKADECTWHPDFMRIRMDQWIDGLSWDWCISRQRYFGVPFPVWYVESNPTSPSPLRGEGRGGGDSLKRYSRDLRSNATEAEKELWNYIRKGQLGGYKFRRQHPMGSKYIADFVCLERKLIVELDGSQHAEQVEYDTKRTEFLNREGYRVFRVWNNEIFENIEGVCEAILDYLDNLDKIPLNEDHPHPNPPPSRGRGSSIIVIARPEDLPVNPLVDLPYGYEKIEKREDGSFLAKDLDGNEVVVIPEADVMDTWATSSVSPQLSSRGITDELAVDAKRHKKLFPADLRPQAHEIIRTWAFYTIVKAHLHENVIPWKNLMISGWCLAADKTKMSKSKGNVVTPVDLIEEKGSDVVRFWASTSRLGSDTAYSEDVLKIGKKLITKLWNATKFAAIHLDKIEQKPGTAKGDVDSGVINEPLDLWVLTKLNKAITKATQEFDKYEYCNARSAAEDFFWNDLCDNYLELVKVRVYGEAEGATKEGQMSAVYTIYHCLDGILRLFAPIVPHITEELYSHIFDEKIEGLGGSIHARGTWLKAGDYPCDDEAEAAGDACVSVLDAVRKMKAERNVSIKWPLNFVAISGDESEAKIGVLADDLKNVTNSSQVLFASKEAKEGQGVTVETDGGKFTVTAEFAEENSDAA